MVERRNQAGAPPAIRCVVALACACLTGAAQGETIRASFTCADGKAIDATFDNGPQPRVSLSLSDGRHLVLPQARSASGARYANAEESFVFWNKGETAFIEEHGRTTYGDCVVKR
jgi:membrane-bound inhibitor of C-type lysozyme